MAENFILNVPNFLMQQINCSVCKGYLSCGPVRVLPDGTSICGRCSPPNNNAPIYRMLTLEAILSKILFPCRFKQYGCQDSVRFGKAVDHETNCPYRSFACPVCSWEERNLQISDHFLQKHPDFVKKDVKFTVHIGEASGNIFLLLKDNVTFIIKYVYNTKGRSLQYDIRYFKNSSKIVENASYKVQLINNSDKDCSVNLKNNSCYAYDSSFVHMRKAKILDLNKFLESLDNPSCIVFKMILKIDFKTKANNDVGDRIISNSFSKLNIHDAPSNNTKTKEPVAKANCRCRWNNCDFVGKSDNIQKHQLHCAWRVFTCGYDLCEHTYILTEAVQHFSNIHKAMYMPNEIVYVTSFIEAYPIRSIVTIKNNTIIVITHTILFLGEKAHCVYLFSPNSNKIKANLVCEHTHCKLKSKVFTFDTKTKLFIKINDLPRCFKTFQNLTVSVGLTIDDEI